MSRKMILAAGVAAAALANAVHETGENGVVIKPRQQGKTEIGDRFGIPDRLCIERDSRYYTSVGSYVGVRFNGEDVSGRVVEFCESKGWVRLANVKPGQPVGRWEAKAAKEQYGEVEAFWRMQPSRQIRRQLERIG